MTVRDELLRHLLDDRGFRQLRDEEGHRPNRPGTVLALHGGFGPGTEVFPEQSERLCRHGNSEREAVYAHGSLLWGVLCGCNLLCRAAARARRACRNRASRTFPPSGGDTDLISHPSSPRCSRLSRSSRTVSWRSRGSSRSSRITVRVLTAMCTAARASEIFATAPENIGYWSKKCGVPGFQSTTRTGNATGDIVDSFLGFDRRGEPVYGREVVLLGYREGPFLQPEEFIARR